jgi:hypothetical protein
MTIQLEPPSAFAAARRDARPRAGVRALVATLVLAAIMVGSVLVLRFDSAVANAWVDEDGPVEYGGALCLAVGVVLAGIGTLRAWRSREPGRLGLVRPLVFLGLTLFLVMATGEEISWGQRILGFGTPAALEGINAQDETTLHNLYGGAHGQNVSEHLFEAAWFGFGVVVPVLASWPRAGALLRRFLPVAPIWLALLFVGQQLLWQPVKADFRRDPGAWNATFRAPIGGEAFRVESEADAAAHGVGAPAGMDEIAETNIELLLMAGAGVCALALPRRRPARSAVERPPVAA